LCNLDGIHDVDSGDVWDGLSARDLERISPRLPWGKRINASGPKISEQHANCTPYPIRRQYKTRCTLAEHCRPLAANLLYARGAAGKA
jgi:hypothetical protein